MGGGDVSQLPLRSDKELSVKEIISKYTPSLKPYEKLYKNLHQFPNLSLLEHNASKIAAAHLRKLSGFEVKTHIGGTGLIGILRNGPGQTILLRADTDALPVEELTGLEYASKVREVDVEDGIEKPVMHACGHDTHITSLLAAAETLHAARVHWSGTIVFLFQPNEERGGGARAMIDDGLYDPNKHACPPPDIVLGQHVMPMWSGYVGTKRGAFGSASDSFEVTLYGRGGHASSPQNTIDPIVLAAAVIMRLQGIVSREVDPSKMAVVTVASIHAGMTENIIADFAELKINVRTTDPETREKVLAAIKRIIKAECDATGVEKEFGWKPTHSLPLLTNDGLVTAHLEPAFSSFFGDNYSPSHPHLGGSEDFAILATECPNKSGLKGVPYSYWVFGGTDPEEWRKAAKEGTLNRLPANHSAKFAPVINPTLETGIKALVVAALSYLH